MSSVKVRAGDRLRRRASGREVIVAGFTTKPRGSSRSDGIRRARLADGSGRETRIIAAQIPKAYEPVGV